MGTKTPILLIVGAFRGGGGAGRWGCPSTVALTCRFSGQEIDVIGSTYSLLQQITSMSNFSRLSFALHPRYSLNLTLSSWCSHIFGCV